MARTRAEASVLPVSSKTRNESANPPAILPMLPRMVAMYLIRENTDVSLGDIGKLFGGRNHATVIHAIEKMKKEISDNNQLQDAAEAIMKKVKG